MKLITINNSVLGNDGYILKCIARLKDYCEKHISQSAIIRGQDCEYANDCLIYRSGACGTNVHPLPTPYHWYNDYVASKNQVD